MNFRLFLPFSLLWITIFIPLSSTFASTTNIEKLNNIKELRHFAFGSCNYQNYEQPLWADIAAQNEDLFLWSGDTIYADWGGIGVEGGFQIQNQNPGYQKLKETTPILGIWDDHDYGLDNGNGNYADKKNSQKYFLDFIEEPLLSLRRFQEGIYESYKFGKEPEQVKMILLDNRYFKDLDPEFPLLGKKQWDWLEKELMSSKASVNFIVSGLPAMAPYLPYVETWPEKELKRMLELLTRTQTKGAVFLSGDRHFSSVYMNHNNLEFMSSALSHTAQRGRRYIAGVYENPFFSISYGQVDIQWDKEHIPTVALSMRTQNGKSFNASSFKWVNSKWVNSSSPSRNDR